MACVAAALALAPPESSAQEAKAPSPSPAPIAAEAGDIAPLSAELTPTAIERLLRPPRGSLSLGLTSGGRLLRARAVRPKGERWAYMPHIPDRGTTYGVDEMATLLDHVGGAVARCRRGAQLRVGNISLRRGGHSPWHRSHQAGRDVDLAPPLLDRHGQPTPSDDFVKLDRHGHARDGSGRVLDVRCTLALALALVDGDGPPVQWAFFARWLNRLVLAEARHTRVQPALIARLEQTLHQPSRAAPHDDHLHVRLFCSPVDRRYGCLDREPWRDWVDRDDAGFFAHIAAVTTLTRAPEARLRRRAVAALVRLRDPAIVPALAPRLLDRDADVRRAALHGLVSVGDEAAVAGIVRALGRTDDDQLAVRLFDTARRLHSGALLAVAKGMLVDPSSALHPLVHAKAGEALLVRAIDVVGEDGGRRGVPMLLDALDHRAVEVRRAAHRALLRLTNQRVDGDVAGAKGSAAVAKRWRSFWAAHGRASTSAWFARGFRDHGVRVRSDRGLVQADIPKLVSALRHRRAEVAHNAARALELLTGQHIVASTSASAYRRWSRWWRRQRASALRGAKATPAKGKAMRAKGAAKRAEGAAKRKRVRRAPSRRR